VPLPPRPPPLQLLPQAAARRGLPCLRKQLRCAGLHSVMDCGVATEYRVVPTQQATVAPSMAFLYRQFALRTIRVESRFIRSCHSHLRLGIKGLFEAARLPRFLSVLRMGVHSGRYSRELPRCGAMVRGAFLSSSACIVAAVAWLNSSGLCRCSSVADWRPNGGRARRPAIVQIRENDPPCDRWFVQVRPTPTL